MPQDQIQDELLSQLKGLLSLPKEQTIELVTKSVIFRPKKPKKTLKNYMQKRTLRCKCCKAKSVYFFLMNDMKNTSALISSPVSAMTAVSASNLQVVNVKQTVTTCPHCMDYVMQMSKEEIAKKYLASLTDWK